MPEGDWKGRGLIIAQAESFEDELGCPRPNKAVWMFCHTLACVNQLEAIRGAWPTLFSIFILEPSSFGGPNDENAPYNEIQRVTRLYFYSMLAWCPISVSDQYSVLYYVAHHEIDHELRNIRHRRQVIENHKRQSCEGIALPFLCNWLLGTTHPYRSIHHPLMLLFCAQATFRI